MTQQIEQSETQAVLANYFAGRFARDDIPLRNSFVASNIDEPPPLAKLVNSGRGWSSRLAVYLTIIWDALPPSYETKLSAQEIADLNGIDNPRQALNAIHALAEANLITIVKGGRGSPLRVKPLDESGTGTPYVSPITTAGRPGQRGFDNLYFKVPVGLWKQGWISVLSGPALATLLIYAQLERSTARKAGPAWLSPGLGKKRYHVGAATRYRGLDELQRYGLVSVQVRGTATPPYRATKRQFVTLHLNRLNAPISVPE